MENNNPQPQPVPSIVQVPTPAPTPARGKTMWLVGLLVIIILMIGGTYLYQSNQQKVTQPSSTPQTAEVSLESELNSVNVEDIEEEFSAVDKDLQNL